MENSDNSRLVRFEDRASVDRTGMSSWTSTPHSFNLQFFWGKPTSKARDPLLVYNTVLKNEIKSIFLIIILYLYYTLMITKTLIRIVGLLLFLTYI